MKTMSVYLKALVTLLLLGTVEAIGLDILGIGDDNPIFFLTAFVSGAAVVLYYHEELKQASHSDTEGDQK